MASSFFDDGSAEAAPEDRHRPLMVGVLGTRAGSTSTYWAVSLAYTLAQHRSVMLVDLDQEGGTIHDLLALPARREAKGINNLGTVDVTAHEIEAQAIPVPKSPSLRVVPGIRDGFGSTMHNVLPGLKKGLSSVSDDVVIADLGHPVSHVGLAAPGLVAEDICRTFDRVFIVMRDAAELVTRAITTLRQANFPKGEIVFCVQTHNRLVDQMTKALAREVPGLQVTSRWNWDERGARQMSDTCTPMLLKGVPEALNLVVGVGGFT